MQPSALYGEATREEAHTPSSAQRAESFQPGERANLGGVETLAPAGFLTAEFLYSLSSETRGMKSMDTVSQVFLAVGGAGNQTGLVSQVAGA